MLRSQKSEWSEWSEAKEEDNLQMMGSVPRERQTMIDLLVTQELVENQSSAFQENVEWRIVFAGYDAGRGKSRSTLSTSPSTAEASTKRKTKSAS